MHVDGDILCSGVQACICKLTSRCRLLLDIFGIGTCFICEFEYAFGRLLLTELLTSTGISHFMKLAPPRTVVVLLERCFLAYFLADPRTRLLLRQVHQRITNWRSLNELI